MPREATATVIETPDTLVSDVVPEPDHRTVLPLAGRTWLSSWVTAGAFGLLFVPQLMLPGVHWKDVLLSSDYYVKLFATMEKDAMPQKVASFQQVDFHTDKREWDNSWGEHSRIWGYREPAGSRRSRSTTSSSSGTT